MHRLFMDANVLFTAAHNATGKSAFIIQMAEQGHWSVISSEYAIEEARRNLLRKFPSAVERLDMLLKVLQKVPTLPVSLPSCPVKLPEKDRPILLAALGCGASHLLTGDIKDFGPHMNKPEKTAGLLIQTVADFLNTL